jgi:tetratricopeptide (TPR) repeat protein
VIRKRGKSRQESCSGSYGLKGLYDQAIADWTKAIELKPDYAEAYFQRGAGYVLKGLSDQAIVDYTKAIELKPDYAKAYFLRSIEYNLKNLHDQAIADSTKVIELKPNFAKAYFARGGAASSELTPRALAIWSTVQPSPLVPPFREKIPLSA